MNKCPKDADETPNDNTRCDEYNDFICTRKKGHRGKHHAHGMKGDCYKIW